MTDPLAALLDAAREAAYSWDRMGDDLHDRLGVLSRAVVAFDAAQPAAPAEGLIAAVEAVRNPYRQGDLHNYGWNDAVVACVRALRAALTPEDDR